MIARYVESLGKKKSGNDQGADGKSKKSIYEEKRKKKDKHDFKAVYAVAADFNSELGLLAIALIDREIKLYKIKQNGTKIRLEEHFSFQVKFPSHAPVTALHIEKYVTNGRPIICLGSQLSEIMIYYLDGEDEKEKPRPYPLRQFKFFERGESRTQNDTGYEESDGEGQDD